MGKLLRPCDRYVAGHYVHLRRLAYPPGSLIKLAHLRSLMVFS